MRLGMQHSRRLRRNGGRVVVLAHDRKNPCRALSVHPISFYVHSSVLLYPSPPPPPLSRSTTKLETAREDANIRRIVNQRIVGEFLVFTAVRRGRKTSRPYTSRRTSFRRCTELAPRGRLRLSVCRRWSTPASDDFIPVRIAIAIRVKQ